MKKKTSKLELKRKRLSNILRSKKFQISLRLRRKTDSELDEHIKERQRKNFHNWWVKHKEDHRLKNRLHMRKVAELKRKKDNKK